MTEAVVYMFKVAIDKRKILLYHISKGGETKYIFMTEINRTLLTESLKNILKSTP